MIIGLTGESLNGNVFGVGKNVAANIICLLGNTTHNPRRMSAAQLEEWYKFFESEQYLGLRKWRIIQFSDLLKNQVGLPWLSIAPNQSINDQQVKNHPSKIPGLTNRDVLERIGDGLRRALHENCWVYGADLEKFTTNDIYGPHAVIPDVRYPNEIEYIHSRGGIVFNIKNSIADEPFRDHYSNTAIQQMRGSLPIIENNELSILKLSENIIQQFEKHHIAHYL